jgi:hypothetical protein
MNVFRLACFPREPILKARLSKARLSKARLSEA